MAASHAGAILRHIHRLAGSRAIAEKTDSQLLQDYTAGLRDEAFAALLHRHGGLVWSVCRHWLPREHDAEDAFQATFLVLARRAASIRRTEAVAGWLHGVAYRIARKARTRTMTRNRRETPLEYDPQAPSVSDLAWRELQAILDEELQRLPVKYRSPFILCCLEGRSRAEVAAELGWKEGTLSSRIAQARTLLQERLTRRGVMLSAALTAGVMWNQPASAALIQAVHKAALLIAGGQAVSAATTPGVAALVESVTGMVGMKAGIVAVLLLVGIIGGTLGVASSDQPARTVQESKNEAKAQTALPRADGPALKTDAFGDPLPPDALVRMGTIRLRQPNPRVVFSADGKSLTSAGADNTVHTWDVATGKCLRTKSLEDSLDLDLSAVSLSPDGKALLLWKHSSKSMVVYDIVSGKKLGSIIERSEGQPHRAAVSPGGKFVAAYIGGGNAQTIRLWDVAAGTERVLLEHKRHDEHLEFSPDGKFLAVAGRDALRIWDTAEVKLLHTLRIEAWSLTFSPDTKALASGNTDGTVKILDVITGKEQATLQTNPRHHIGCLTYSPDGKLLAVGGQRSLRIWDVASAKMLKELPDRHVGWVKFAPDGKLLATSGGSAVRLWDVATGKRLLFAQGPGSPGKQSTKICGRYVQRIGRILNGL